MTENDWLYIGSVKTQTWNSKVCVFDTGLLPRNLCVACDGKELMVTCWRYMYMMSSSYHAADECQVAHENETSNKHYIGTQSRCSANICNFGWSLWCGHVLRDNGLHKICKTNRPVAFEDLVTWPWKTKPNVQCWIMYATIVRFAIETHAHFALCAIAELRYDTAMLGDSFVWVKQSSH